MRVRLGLALSLVFVAACAENHVAGPPPEPTTPRPASSAPAIEGEAANAEIVDAGADATACESPKPAWADLVRAERWSDAAAAIDALEPVERDRPATKYARARVALALKDAVRARDLLVDLEHDLPLLDADVKRFRALAELEVGPFADAAAYFAKSTRARDLANAALAYDRAGDAAKARAVADRAVTASGQGKVHAGEAAAHLARAKISEKTAPAQAESDYRWVAVHAPASLEAREANAALERMKKALSEPERAKAVAGLVDAASPGAATEIKKLPAPSDPKGLHARAVALFKARDYIEAAKAYDASARAGGPTAAEDLFYAGRSLARAGQDAEAEKRLQDVIKRFPASSYNEKASYLLARVALSAGRFDDAVAAYDKYLATWKRGDHKGEAEYERAVAAVSSSDPKKASELLAKLRERSTQEIAGRLRELEGVASARAGDKDRAVAIWTEVAREQPLTWAALMARARLEQAAAPVATTMPEKPPVPAQPLDVSLPPGPSLLRSIGLDDDAERYLAPLEGTIAGLHPGRETEALCTAYGSLAAAKRRFSIGQKQVALSVLMRAPSSSERWAWDCLYPRPYDAEVRGIEGERGLPRGFLFALMRQESAFDPVIVSRASAVGLMQLMPYTAAQIADELKVELDRDHLVDPATNIRLGAAYVDKLYKMFQQSVVLSAAAYNAGPRAVSHWVEIGKDNEVDLFVARIPYDETRGYVARVAQNLARYQWLEGGEAAMTKIALTLPANAKATDDAY